MRSRSAWGSICGWVSENQTIGAAPNQMATASAQPRWPAAQAVASATDSGTAANRPVVCMLKACRVAAEASSTATGQRRRNNARAAIVRPNP
jgi:hypothetical protein